MNFHARNCNKCFNPIIYTPVYAGDLCGDCWREVSQKLEWDRSVTYAREAKSPVKPAKCIICDTNISDYPSNICPGCEAYLEHQK